MNRIILLIAVTFLALNVFSQSKPPKKIRNILDEMYENVEIIKTQDEWEGEGRSKRYKFWKIMFKSDGVLSSASFDNKANWLETKTKISEDELPEPVLKSIEENYYMYKIVIVARFENPEDKGYEVFMTNEIDGFDVQFSKDGDIISRIIRSGGYKAIDDDGNQIEE